MITVLKNGAFTCVQLEPKDTEAYCDVAEAVFVDAEASDDRYYYPPNFIEGIKKEFKDAAARRDYWRDDFRKSLTDPDTENTHFALFETRRNHGPAIAGLSKLSLFFPLGNDPGDANLNGCYIMSTYRGQHLADMFYTARMHFALGETECKHIFTDIDPGNIPSSKAATRNGFVFSGLTHGGRNPADVYVFDKNVGLLRTLYRGTQKQKREKERSPSARPLDPERISP